MVLRTVARLLVAATLVACRAGYVELGENRQDDGMGGVVGDAGQDDTTSNPDTGSNDAGPPSQLPPTGFCEGRGPAVPLPIFGECTGDVAKKTFRFAVCSCTNINLSGNLVTDAFNSGTGEASTTAASIGVDGTYSSTSTATVIGGSLWTNADTNMAGHTISGELQCGGNLVVDGNSSVGADAFVAGSVQGGIAIGGTLHLPAGQPHQQASAAGGVVEQDVTIAPPCDCSKRLDVGSIVDELKQDNDNAAIGLAPEALANVDVETSLSLPCGRYFLSEISGGAALTVRVTGRVAIGVEGSLIHNLSAVNFVVDQGAELDLFVAGDMLFSGPVQIGSKARPAATRLYVGGMFGYDGTFELAANLYLPHGSFTTTTARTEVWGALFADNFGVTGDLIVHYDPSILDVDGCAPPGDSCDSCNDCANPAPACKGGACVKCEADSDCCPPLHCSDGACVPGPL